MWSPTGRETEDEMVARAGRGLAIVMDKSWDDTCEWERRSDARHLCHVAFWVSARRVQEPGCSRSPAGDGGDERAGCARTAGVGGVVLYQGEKMLLLLLLHHIVPTTAAASYQQQMHVVSRHGGFITAITRATAAAATLLSDASGVTSMFSPPAVHLLLVIHTSCSHRVSISTLLATSGTLFNAARVSPAWTVHHNSGHSTSAKNGRLDLAPSLCAA